MNTPLKQIVDENLQPFMNELKTQVSRLKVITAELMAVRSSLLSPAPGTPEVSELDDREMFRTVLAQYRVWCARHRGSPLRSLARLMLIAMSAETQPDPALVKLNQKLVNPPPAKPEADLEG